MARRSEPPGKPQVDKAAALQLLAGDRELLRELAQMFCEDAPIVFEDLQSAVSSGDPGTARRAAHSLKGSASTFFAQPTVELASQLEAHAASGDLDNMLPCDLDTLKELVDSLVSELRTLASQHPA